MSQLETIREKLDKMDEKLDILVKEHAGVFKDVEWLKGSLKLSLTLFIPAILAAVGFLMKDFFK